MIHKYLKDLVENNNRIIIPDFGAFMVQNTPEGKQITFNDFLKFNDGLLINQIIKSEKISKIEASDHVKAFVKDIESAFSKGESFEVKEIGFLVKDDHGNIKFESKKASAEQETQPTDPKPTIVLDEKSEPSKEVKPEEKKAEAPKAPEQAKETKTEKKPEVKEKPEEKPAPKVEAKKDLKPTQTVKKQPTKIPQKPANTSKPAMNKNVKKPTPSAASTSTSKNNNSTLIIIIAAAVIIIGGGVFAALKLHWFGIGQEPEPVVEVVPMEEPVIDTLPKEDTIKVVEEQPKVIEEEPAPEVDPNTKRYYIVAGSFKVATNAENFSQKLIDEGYKSEVIVRSNGYHTVSYKTLYEWNEALSEWRNMRNINSQTWILVK